jgi:hypothetical protein
MADAVTRDLGPMMGGRITDWASRGTHGMRAMATAWLTQIMLFVAILVAPLAAPAPAWGQPSSKVDFAYVPPSTVKYQAIMERLKSRQYLERLSEFLAPVRFPHPFHLLTEQCGQVNAFYSPDRWAIILCYEWIEEMDRIAPRQPVEGVTHRDVVIGETVATVLHELGHAAFDMFRVPRAGREEDAADQFMAFLALEFGNEVARTIVNGEAYFWYNVDPARFVAWTNWADEHGTNAQRFYNTLCMAYGKDPQSFKDLVEKQWLPADRAGLCAVEFEQIRSAFVKTVLPFIDRDKIEELRSRRWLPPRAERGQQ